MHVNDILYIEVLRDKVYKINNELIESQCSIIDAYLLNYVCYMADTCKISRLIELLAQNDFYELNKFLAEIRGTIKPLVCTYNEIAIYKKIRFLPSEIIEEHEKKNTTISSWRTTVLMLLNSLKEALHLRNVEITLAAEIYLIGNKD